jgi:hypothetical protein
MGLLLRIGPPGAATPDRGTQTEAEEPGSPDNFDIILTLKDDSHAIILLKYTKDIGQKDINLVLQNLTQSALLAIKEKRYDEQYRHKGKDFIAVGLGVFGRGQAKVLFG